MVNINGICECTCDSKLKQKKISYHWLCEKEFICCCFFSVHTAIKFELGLVDINWRRHRRWGASYDGKHTLEKIISYASCVEVRKGIRQCLYIYVLPYHPKMPLSHSLNHPQLSVIANDVIGRMRWWKMKIPAMLACYLGLIMFTIMGWGWISTQDAFVYVLQASKKIFLIKSIPIFFISLLLLLVPLTCFRRQHTNMFTRNIYSNEHIFHICSNKYFSSSKIIHFDVKWKFFIFFLFVEIHKKK
jgi:hypothetical protein